MVTGSAELAATQTEQWDSSRVLATELQSSLQNMKEGEIGSLLEALVSIQSQLVSEPSKGHERVNTDRFQQTSSELVAFMYLRQNELYEVHVLHWPTFNP